MDNDVEEKYEIGVDWKGLKKGYGSLPPEDVLSSSIVPLHPSLDWEKVNGSDLEVDASPPLAAKVSNPFSREYVFSSVSPKTIWTKGSEETIFVDDGFSMDPKEDVDDSFEAKAMDLGELLEKVNEKYSYDVLMAELGRQLLLMKNQTCPHTRKFKFSKGKDPLMDFLGETFVDDEIDGELFSSTILQDGVRIVFKETTFDDYAKAIGFLEPESAFKYSDWIAAGLTSSSDPSKLVWPKRSLVFWLMYIWRNSKREDYRTSENHFLAKHLSMFDLEKAVEK